MVKTFQLLMKIFTAFAGHTNSTKINATSIPTIDNIVHCSYTHCFIIITIVRNINDYLTELLNL